MFSPTGTNHAPNGDTPDVYHVSRPNIGEARDAVHRLYGATAPGLWTTLLARARLVGTETDPASIDRLIAVMLDADPVTALCARSLKIRADTHTHLSAVHTLIRTAE